MIAITRLSSGEEIVSDLKIAGDTYQLIDPMIIIPTGNGNIGISKFLPYADAEVLQISKKFVMFTVPPVAQLLALYHQHTSPVIVPEIKEIVTN